LVLALTGTDPDRFEEEKRRGLTIDLGFAHTTLPSGAGISFVDVPGHVRFLRNMLAGVGGVDACLFVVAATEGWKPQSEEHLRILELLGISHGVVALTKADLVDDEGRELALLDVGDHIAATFLQDAPVVLVSTATGEGLDELRRALDDLVATTPAALDRTRPRLWVDRVFAAKGSGTVVTGTLTGGSLARDEAVVVEPGSRPARVRSIQTLGSGIDRIGPGNRVALNLAGIAHDDIGRGDAIVTPGRWLPTRRFDATLEVLASLDHDVSRRGAYLAYVGSREVPVKVRVIGSDALAPGAAGTVRLHLPVDLPLLPGDRYVLRESGRDETVGGGEVLDVAPVRPASKAAPDRDVGRVIQERGWIDVAELELLTGTRVAPALGRWAVGSDTIKATADELRARIEASGSIGLDVATLDERQRAVLDTLEAIVIEAGRARPAEADDPFLDHPFVAAARAGGFAPPGAGDVDRAELRELVRRGILVERDGVVFHPDTVDDAGRIAAALLAGHPEGFTVAQFRDATGASRKYVLPLVSELDARAVTRRRGDLRIGGPHLPEA
jgi:selenocysteine-specific elongation factor